MAPDCGPLGTPEHMCAPVRLRVDSAHGRALSAAAMIVMDPPVDWGAAFNARFGPSSHLMSTLVGEEGARELAAFVARVGIPGRPHHAGTWREHYDVAGAWVEIARAAGAVPVDRVELVRVLKARREAMGR